MFQSAPPAEARGDWNVDGPVPFRVSFNPLPLPKQGEIGLRLSPFLLVYVSIRSPCRSKGRYRRRGSISPSLTRVFESGYYSGG